ncbi:MAG: hypothetical protein F9K23_17410 [Bacteroidetes bacterium]|nr:MAG: hypothetical protein F9K23_17410 [Bacteroidota bacterium]
MRKREKPLKQNQRKEPGAQPTLRGQDGFQAIERAMGMKATMNCGAAFILLAPLCLPCKLWENS